MNEGIHLDLDTWIVPGQIRKANLCRGLGNRYTPAGTEVLISESYFCNNTNHTHTHTRTWQPSTSAWEVPPCPAVWLYSAFCIGIKIRMLHC